MLTASPITNQPVGKTFTFAISVLGAGAALELVLIGWAFWKRPPIAFVVQPAPGVAQVTHSGAAGPVAAPETPASVGEEAPLNLVNNPDGTAGFKPTPVTSKAATPEPATRFEELVAQGKELRDRGDTSAAIIKFREGATLEPKSPIPLAELAATYEKMGMADKANEQWKRIFDMGPAAGPYYTAAEAKRQAFQFKAMNQVASQRSSSSDQAPDTTTPIAGIADGAILGLLPVATEDVRDDNSAKRFILHVPIKARPNTRVDVKDLIIHVLFYDIVDGQNVVQTSAEVKSKWTTPPPDWINTDTEELAVEYQLSKSEARAAKRESRKYYGYIVRIYYKQQLQAATADPSRLAQQYPAPSSLPKENEK